MRAFWLYNRCRLGAFRKKNQKQLTHIEHFPLTVQRMRTNNPKVVDSQHRKKIETPVRSTLWFILILLYIFILFNETFCALYCKPIEKLGSKTLNCRSGDSTHFIAHMCAILVLTQRSKATPIKYYRKRNCIEFLPNAFRIMLSDSATIAI